MTIIGRLWVTAEGLTLHFERRGHLTTESRSDNSGKDTEIPGSLSQRAMINTGTLAHGVNQRSATRKRELPEAERRKFS
jgi:hypothetical protein